MGGNALSVESVRLNRDDYFVVASNCVRTLRAMYPGNRIEDIVAYASKESFGDLDILVESTGYDPYKAAESLGATEIVRNGDVTSIGVLVCKHIPVFDPHAVFQVDLIKSSSAAFGYSLGYFGFNDLGNLTGRISRLFEAKHAHDGLWMPLREGDHLYGTLGLTQNFEEALAYLGYDPERYRRGFNNLEDIFKFVVSTEYFNKNRYLLENRNNVSRTRDRKRKTYTDFLKWIADRNDLPEYPEVPSFEQCLERAVTWFPHVAQEYAQAQQKLQRQRDVKARFSGEVAAALTGFEGKQLGFFMKNFRHSFLTPEDYDNFVLTASDAELFQKVQMIKLSVS